MRKHEVAETNAKKYNCINRMNSCGVGDISLSLSRMTLLGTKLRGAVSAPLAPGAAGGDSPGGLAEEPSPRGIDENCRFSKKNEVGLPFHINIFRAARAAFIIA